MIGTSGRVRLGWAVVVLLGSCVAHGAPVSMAPVVPGTACAPNRTGDDRFGSILSLTVDPASGDVYAADGSASLRRVSPGTGAVGTMTAPVPASMIAFDPAGRSIVGVAIDANGTGVALFAVNADTPGTTSSYGASMAIDPTGMAIGDDGTVYMVLRDATLVASTASGTRTLLQLPLSSSSPDCHPSLVVDRHDTVYVTGPCADNLLLVADVNSRQYHSVSIPGDPAVALAIDGERDLIYVGHDSNVSSAVTVWDRSTLSLLNTVHVPTAPKHFTLAVDVRTGDLIIASDHCLFRVAADDVALGVGFKITPWRHDNALEFLWIIPVAVIVIGIVVAIVRNWCPSAHSLARRTRPDRLGAV